MATTINMFGRNISSLTRYSFTEADTGSFTTSVQASTVLIARDADTKEWGRALLGSQYFPTWIGWRVARATAEFTISGTVTFSMFAKSSIAGAGRLHAKLYKRTAGGSDVDTLIAEADAAVDISLTPSVVATFAVTPPNPVTLVAGERLLLKVFVKRRSADFDTAVFTLEYNSAIKNSRVVLTETVTFQPDKTNLIFRRTAVNAIGNFFDLLSTVSGVAATTGVVNTAASGTEIQWTRTAGGTPLEWITPRFKYGWDWLSLNQSAGGFVRVHESNLAANCSCRLKFFRRTPSGAEDLMITSSYGSELTTTSNYIGMPTDATWTPLAFAEDDRLVCRPYIYNIGTMGGSQTCTFTYDGPIGDEVFQLYELAPFKAETDPARNDFIPDGLNTLGIGN